MRRFYLEDRLILHLCSNNYDRASVLEEIRHESVSWRRLIKTAQAHRVSPLVHERLLALPLPPGARTVLQDVGQREIVSVIHDNAVFKSELALIQQKLDEKKIDVILLKGLSLNFTGLRWMGDIDLLVNENHVARTIDSLLEIEGYSYWRKSRCRFDGTVFSRKLPETERQRVQAQIVWNNEFQLRNQGKGVLVEIHHKPFEFKKPNEKYQENIEGVQRGTPIFWQRRCFETELGCFTLSAAHSLLITCLRNAIKQQPANGKFRLSNLVDIDNLVAAGVPWSLFLRDCLEMEAAPYALFSLRLARSFLGTPIPPSVLQELRGACTSRQIRAMSIHHRCVESLDSHNLLYCAIYKARSPWAFGGPVTEKLRWSIFMPLWLPSRSAMAETYGLRKTSPLIALAYLANPVRWVSRILRSLLSRM